MVGPDVPRPNAMRCDDGAIQFVMPALPTVLWKAVMPANATQRCWQSQPFDPPVPLQVPYPPFGAPALVSDKE